MSAQASSKEKLLGDAAMPEDLAAKKALEEKKRTKILVICFALMIVIGLANKILGILLYTPMNNYPLFVNLLTTFAYLPVSLAYVLPVQHTRPDIITPEARAVPQKVWAIMGGLDSIAGIMQSLSTAKLSKSGALIVLLTQAAIPFSMVITKVFLKAKYRVSQYVGAAAVIAGILIVLLPGLIDGSSSGSSTGVWAAVLVLSCIPMCLSSVYKEKALGDREIDPVYLNYWVAVYQLIIAFPLLIPTGLAVDVSPASVPSNLLAGLKCYVGVNTVVGGSQPDNCTQGPIFVNFYILANLAYNVLIILLIKYGSSNILWLCLTLQVPVANLAFALPFMPNSKPITWEDGVGLVVIMLGLCIYRFYKPLTAALSKRCGGGRKGADVSASESASASLLDGSSSSSSGVTAAPMLTHLPGTADDGSAGLLAVASDSPGSNLGGSTPVLGLHVPRATKNKAGTGAHVPTAQEKAQALAQARQRKAEGYSTGSGPSRQRGGSR